MLLAGQLQYGSVSGDNRFAMDRGCDHQDECSIAHQWEAIVVCVQSHTEDTSASEPTSWCSLQVDKCVNLWRNSQALAQIVSAACSRSPWLRNFWYARTSTCPPLDVTCILPYMQVMYFVSDHCSCRVSICSTQDKCQLSDHAGLPGLPAVCSCTLPHVGQLTQQS